MQNFLIVKEIILKWLNWKYKKQKEKNLIEIN